MRSVAVIGKNFGDEGKGLVSASLCFSSTKPLIIKHNGGAQAGHTVEDSKLETRFVHHQTGSGSEYGAPTLFAATYHPDLYQLGKEIEEFREVYHFTPKLYSEADTAITTIDDVLVNMLAETLRGLDRHGSCGMGIYECCQRIEASGNLAGAKNRFAITVSDVVKDDAVKLFEKLKYIRENYTAARLETLLWGSRENASEGRCTDMVRQYLELLEDDEVLEGFALEIKDNAKYIEIVNADKAFLENYDEIVFETGQGLLLDENNVRFAPHVTGSKTGIYEPVLFLERRGLDLDEAIYVTRPYVTRHGAGPLPCECSIEELPGVTADRTNITNEWQGSIRYARHESEEAFIEPMLEDIRKSGKTKLSLAVTHLDETADRMYFDGCTIGLEDFEKTYREKFYRIYTSHKRDGLD